MITLRAGDWTLGLRPELGGAIGELRRGDRDILRPTPLDATDPLQAACFPLLPYANRIAGAHFDFGGRAVRLTPTPGFEPHALHGVGWRAPWEVSNGADWAMMTLAHDGRQAAGDWPWSFEASQRFDLSEDGLTVSLSMTNTDAAPMPAGLGLHPYLARRHGARLSLAAAGVWTSSPDQIPVALRPPSAVFDWSDGPALDAAPFVDNAYVAWDGVATLSDEAGEVELRAGREAAFVHVYAPQDASFVCVEPVTHRPNAVNAPGREVSGLIVLAPGETRSMSLTITAR